MGWALKMNQLKMSCSEMAPKLVHEALQIIGIMAYKNDSKFSRRPPLPRRAVGGADGLERTHRRQERVDAPRVQGRLTMPATDYDAQKFHDGLVKAGLIIPVGVQGAFGRNHVFEDVLERLQRRGHARSRSDDGAEYFVFPPMIDRKVLEKTDYMDIVPAPRGHRAQLLRQGARRAQAVASGSTPASRGATQMGITDVTLNPAACYPVYPSFTGTVPDGRPARHDAQLGVSPRAVAGADAHAGVPRARVRALRHARSGRRVARHVARSAASTLLESLGLPATSDVATDPFFGKGGKMLAASQREQKLKFEVLVPVISKEKPTACCSFNYPRGALRRGVRDQDRRTATVANTACLGFGLERCVMALFQTHGFDPGAWPSAVRANSAVAAMMTVLDLDAASYARHALHAEDRVWVEKNCYVDIWIEVIHALGCEPLAMLPFVVALDFEGDQWTFFKPPHDELRDALRHRRPGAQLLAAADRARARSTSRPAS